MAASFQGLPKQTLKFFKDLEKNNDRDWFDAHKSVYLECVKAPVQALVEDVGAALVKFAPEMMTTPAKAIYRIYRDTRFSSDKTPYKTHAGASFFRSDLGRHISAGFYFEVSHKHVGIAGGVYMPEAENLRLIRTHIMEHHQRFQELLQSKKLRESMGELQGERLSRPPKGFPAEHPAMEWIKMKQMYYWLELDAELATTPELLTELATRFKLMYPVMAFFNEPLLELKSKRAPMESGWV